MRHKYKEEMAVDKDKNGAASGSRGLPVVYVLAQHWASGVETGDLVEIYADLDDARTEMRRILKEEMETGIAAMREKGGFTEDTAEDAYECYIEGEYCENHYSIAIEAQRLHVSEAFIRGCGDRPSWEQASLGGFFGSFFHAVKAMLGKEARSAPSGKGRKWTGQRRTLSGKSAEGFPLTPTWDRKE